MADNSVDCVITDPPYYSTDLHFDKAERIDFKNWLQECKRVLKPHGVLVSFADLNLLAELRGYKVFKSTYELIWEKTLAVGFLDANIRLLRNHEFIGVFVDGLKKSTYNPQKTDGKPFKTKRSGQASHYRTHGNNTIENTGERHPKSVLKFSNNNYKSQHPTAKPIDLLQWLIKTYTNDGDTVLDPFMGSGTTGAACKLLNRSFIGCELDAGYFEIAQNRINAIGAYEDEPILKTVTTTKTTTITKTVTKTKTIEFRQADLFV